MEKEIYLDWSATSYKKPTQVLDAMISFIEDVGVSSGRGAYKRAFAADNIVYECRKEVARLFSVSDPARIAFTSGATESINLLLKGFLQPGDHVVTTSLEHNAVIRTLHRLKLTRDVDYTIVHCDSGGHFDLTDFKKSVRPNTKLFALNHASNVIGRILPIRAITKIAHEHNAKIMLDTAQSAGSLEVNVAELDVDLLAFAGHKSLLGPQGVGGVYIREGITLATFKEGGTGSDSKSRTMPENLPERFEAGTLNYPGIAGLKEGLKYINSRGVTSIRKAELEVIKYALERLKALEHLTLYGSGNADDTVGVFALNVKGYEPSVVAHTLDIEHGIMVRSGLHCAPLAHESIGTLDGGALRASIGYTTTKHEIDVFIDALEKLR